MALVSLTHTHPHYAAVGHWEDFVFRIFVIDVRICRRGNKSVGVGVDSAIDPSGAGVGSCRRVNGL